MPVDKELLDILVCPNDRGEPRLRPAGEDVLVRRSCGYRYAVRDDIPNMLIEDAQKPGPWTATMVLDDQQAVLAGDPGAGCSPWSPPSAPSSATGHARGRSAPGLPSGDGVTLIVVAGMGGSGRPATSCGPCTRTGWRSPSPSSRATACPEFCGRNTSSSPLRTREHGRDPRRIRRGRVQGVPARGGHRRRACRRGRGGGGRDGADSPRRPVPRAALRYLVGAILGVLDAMGLPPSRAGRSGPGGGRARRAGPVARTPTAARPERGQVAARGCWAGPVVWGTEGLAEAPALRWKTQCNENAKVPALVGILPELDHNDIEGWSPGAGAGFGLVVLRHAGEDPRVARRVAATLEAIGEAGLESREVQARGDSPSSAPCR